MEKSTAVILAAGKGVRMNSDKAKVLHSLGGKPLICWVVDSALQAGCGKVVVVVGHQADEVKKFLPDGVVSVMQEPQLGTGHAVVCAKSEFAPNDGYVFVLCGDVPLIRPGTLHRLLKKARDTQASAVILTFNPPGEHHYGRIVRDAGGSVKKIVEYKDATEEERKIREANSGTYVFKIPDLSASLDRLTNKNVQSEYYLTDVIEILLNDGKTVSALVSESALEVNGVNSQDQLRALESMIFGRSAGAGGS
jgi:bifunctional UDP-N-acetylglucosamine pyrophosphorylase / glucosamine-1-phosphate N-acetyltransferase